VTRNLQEEVPFTDTGGFIGVLVAVGVLLCCIMMCVYNTISNRRWVDQLRIKLDARTKVAQTAKG
jgi:pimeloyl-ACP methyl ester carboxylesterase